MKFIKVKCQNDSDFILVNLSNISHISVNNKSGTIVIHLLNNHTISCFPVQASSVLKQISEYNQQLISLVNLFQEEEGF